jgi:hypothetical protein
LGACSPGESAESQASLTLSSRGGVEEQPSAGADRADHDRLTLDVEADLSVRFAGVLDFEPPHTYTVVELLEIRVRGGQQGP